jgi:hypothetical protein
VAQTMYAHVKKCKNDKIKFFKSSYKNWIDQIKKRLPVMCVSCSLFKCVHVCKI